jgi:hypothetical protein
MAAIVFVKVTTVSGSGLNSAGASVLPNRERRKTRGRSRG